MHASPTKTATQRQSWAEAHRDLLARACNTDDHRLAPALVRALQRRPHHAHGSNALERVVNAIAIWRLLDEHLLDGCVPVVLHMLSGCSCAQSIAQLVQLKLCTLTTRLAIQIATKQFADVWLPREQSQSMRTALHGYWFVRVPGCTFGLMKSVAPQSFANASFSGFVSTAKMRLQPASTHASMTARPTAPRPKTAAVVPFSTFAVLNTAPQPVAMPQPSRHTCSPAQMVMSYLVDDEGWLRGKVCCAAMPHDTCPCEP